MAGSHSLIFYTEVGLTCELLPKKGERPRRTFWVVPGPPGDFRPLRRDRQLVFEELSKASLVIARQLFDNLRQCLGSGRY